MEFDNRNLVWNLKFQEDLKTILAPTERRKNAFSFIPKLSIREGYQEDIESLERERKPNHTHQRQKLVRNTELKRLRRKSRAKTIYVRKTEIRNTISR